MYWSQFFELGLEILNERNVERTIFRNCRILQLRILSNERLIDGL